MFGIPSVRPEEVEGALIVSAYENTDRFHYFRKHRIEGSISFPEFLKKRVRKGRTIVFYCA